MIFLLNYSPATYPQWPTDFNWNTQGQPQNCGCQACGCQCVHMNEPSAGVEWKNNYLCYKKKDEVQPGIEWSHEGKITNPVRLHCKSILYKTKQSICDNHILHLIKHPLSNTKK